jgi:hypothetical protein
MLEPWSPTHDEFNRVFYAAVKEITGLEPSEVQRRPGAIDPQLREIDAFVRKTEVLERLTLAIDNLTWRPWDMPICRNLRRRF